MSHPYSGPDYGFPMGTSASTLLTCMPSPSDDQGTQVNSARMVARSHERSQTNGAFSYLPVGFDPCNKT
jgi:hypothetical protein